MTDRWTDDWCTDGGTHRKILLLSHTLTLRGSDVASLVGPPRDLGGDSMMDRRTDGRTDEGVGVYNIPITFFFLSVGIKTTLVMTN